MHRRVPLTASRLTGLAVTTALSLALILTSGCSASRPVLYPNATLSQQGRPAANRAIDECLSLAKQAGAGGGRTAAIAAGTAKSATVGAAVGAAAGAVRGNAGRYAATGAAGAAAGGLVHGLFSASEPTRIEKAFVQECLRERGYRTIGWN